MSAHGATGRFVLVVLAALFGTAGGSWLAGSVADGAGSYTAFLLAVIAGVTAVFVASTRRSRLIVR